MFNLGRWYTLLAFNGSLSPLSQGELVFSAAFTETLDTSNDIQTRQGGPYLRWNFRRGSYLEATYNWLDSTTGATNTSLAPAPSTSASACPCSQPAPARGETAMT